MPIVFQTLSTLSEHIQGKLIHVVRFMPHVHIHVTKVDTVVATYVLHIVHSLFSSHGNRLPACQV